MYRSTCCLLAASTPKVSDPLSRKGCNRDSYLFLSSCLLRVKRRNESLDPLIWIHLCFIFIRLNYSFEFSMDCILLKYPLPYKYIHSAFPTNSSIDNPWSMIFNSAWRKKISEQVFKLIIIEFRAWNYKLLDIISNSNSLDQSQDCDSTRYTQLHTRNVNILSKVFTFFLFLILPRT